MGNDSYIRRPRARRTSAIAPALSSRALPLVLAVETEGRRWTCLGAQEPGEVAAQVAAALVGQHKLPAGRSVATLMLSTDARVRLLNMQWRGIDKATNVLSFASAAPPSHAGTAEARHLGDLILARETLVREAADLQISVGDHFRHLVLHGLLHLLGYDHETDEDAEEMEALETRILATLGVADPYDGTEPVRQGGGKPAPRRPGTRPR